MQKHGLTFVVAFTLSLAACEGSGVFGESARPLPSPIRRDFRTKQTKEASGLAPLRSREARRAI
jgi:hypothetical protein